MATYLAGPIAGCDDAGKNRWREVATERLGSVINPTQWSHNVVALDKAAIRRSEAVLAWCPHPTVGTSMEIMYAHMIGVPVVAVVPWGVSISPWLTAHAKYVATDLVGACALIREMLCST